MSLVSAVIAAINKYVRTPSCGEWRRQASEDVSWPPLSNACRPTPALGAEERPALYPHVCGVGSPGLGAPAHIPAPVGGRRGVTELALTPAWGCSSPTRGGGMTAPPLDARSHLRFPEPTPRDHERRLQAVTINASCRGGVMEPRPVFFGSAEYEASGTRTCRSPLTEQRGELVGSRCLLYIAPSCVGHCGLDVATCVRERHLLAVSSRPPPASIRQTYRAPNALCP